MCACVKLGGCECVGGRCVLGGFITGNRSVLFLVLRIFSVPKIISFHDSNIGLAVDGLFSCAGCLK